MSATGQSRPGRANSKPGQVRYAAESGSKFAALAIVFIGAEVLGSVYLVMAGIAPSSGFDLVKIIIGGAIAIALMLYIGRRSFA
jgi:hypothetical protein